MRKLFATMGLMAAMAAGSALAQDGSSSTTKPADKNNMSPLENQEMMKPFYTDDSMSTMRSGEEFRTAWMNMGKEDQTAIIEQCKQTQAKSPKMEQFCTSAATMNPM